MDTDRLHIRSIKGLSVSVVFADCSIRIIHIRTPTRQKYLATLSRNFGERVAKYFCRVGVRSPAEASSQGKIAGDAATVQLE